MATSKIDLAKFNGKNDFTLWKVKMEALLTIQGLDNAIEPITKKEGKEISSSKTHDQAAEIDNKAISTINFNLNDFIIREVPKKKIIVQLWAKLEKLCMTRLLQTDFISRKGCLL